LPLASESDSLSAPKSEETLTTAVMFMSCHQFIREQ
jgi:hypothetical protein